MMGSNPILSTTNNNNHTITITKMAELKNCPFCGEQPSIANSWYPATVSVYCKSDECSARPSVAVEPQMYRNPGKTETYSPDFEAATVSVIEQWNTRYE